MSRGRTPESPLQLPWLFATVAVYGLASVFVFRNRHSLAHAASWACLSAVWLAFVLVVDWLLLRLRRRNGAARAWSLRRMGWRWALYLGVFLTAKQFGSDLVPTLAACAAVILVELTVRAVARRQDAARHRRELSELTGKF